MGISKNIKRVAILSIPRDFSDRNLELIPEKIFEIKIPEDIFFETKTEAVKLEVFQGWNEKMKRYLKKSPKKVLQQFKKHLEKSLKTSMEGNLKKVGEILTGNFGRICKGSSGGIHEKKILEKKSGEIPGDILDEILKNLKRYPDRSPWRNP